MADRILIAQAATAWSTAASWTGTDTPDDTDNVYLTNSNVDIAGSDETANHTTGVALLDIRHDYTGKIGSVGTPPAVSSTYLKIPAVLCRIGDYLGQVPNSINGSSQIMLDLHTVATTLTVYRTGRMGTGNYGRQPLLILATNSANIAHIRGGIVGMAVLPSETSEFATVNIGAFGEPVMKAEAPDVTIGGGMTLATLNVDTGRSRVYCALTTANYYGGHNQLFGTGNITTINVRNGARLVVEKSGGTITTLTIDPGGSVDLTRATGLTITNTSFSVNSLRMPATGVTFTNTPVPRDKE